MKKRNKLEVLSGQRIKIAALLAGISLLLLSGCGNKAQEAEGSQVQTDIAVTATEQTAAAEEQAETTDPETLDYAYRLHITINPEFRLYLDEQSKVVAVACLNQDAEDLFSETDLTGMDVEKAMPVIIQQAVAKEYLADGKNITIDLEKSTESGQADTVEQVIAAAVTAELKEQGVDATSGTSCRHCGGSGGNTCQQCGGSGGKSCSICHGKGVISDDCILCHGDKKCTVCGGTGEL